MSDVTPDEMRAEADRLDREAALLERWAAERYDDSARLYRGGSSTFVMSIDTADGRSSRWSPDAAEGETAEAE